MPSVKTAAACSTFLSFAGANIPESQPLTTHARPWQSVRVQYDQSGYWLIA